MSDMELRAMDARLLRDPSLPISVETKSGMGCALVVVAPLLICAFAKIVERLLA
jgi:hypothetical protein